MNNTIVHTRQVDAQDTLSELAAQINEAHQAGETATRRGLEHFRQAGELLLKAKARCGHGHWLNWLKENCPSIGERRAQRYMDLAKSDAASDLDAAWKRICGHQERNQHEDDAPPQDDFLAYLEEQQRLLEADSTPINWVDKQCESVEWYTPAVLLDRVRLYFQGSIPLDPATAPSNPTKALRFFTEADDGLVQDWSGQGVFLNPPYGDVLPTWTEKLHEEAGKGTPILALLPCGARFSTAYWQENVLNDHLDAICFVRGRVAFVDEAGNPQKGNPYDSAVYGYNVDPVQFVKSFTPLGKVLLVKEAHE